MQALNFHADHITRGFYFCRLTLNDLGCLTNTDQIIDLLTTWLLLYLPHQWVRLQKNTCSIWWKAEKPLTSGRHYIVAAYTCRCLFNYLKSTALQFKNNCTEPIPGKYHLMQRKEWALLAAQPQEQRYLSSHAFWSFPQQLQNSWLFLVFFPHPPSPDIPVFLDKSSDI